MFICTGTNETGIGTDSTDIGTEDTSSTSYVVKILPNFHCKIVKVLALILMVLALVLTILTWILMVLALKLMVLTGLALMLMTLVQSYLMFTDRFCGYLINLSLMNH